MNAGVVRVGGGDLTQVLQRAVEIAFLTQRPAQIEMRGEAVRLERQRLVENVDRFGKVAALGQRRSQVRQRAAVLRIQRDGFPELGDRAGQIRLFRERNAEPVVRFSRLRSDLDRPLERLQRTRIVIAIPIREPKNDMNVRIVRIAPGRRFEIRQRGRLVRDTLRRGDRWNAVNQQEPQSTQRPQRRGPFVPFATIHRSGSSNLSCNRDVSSSSLRSVFASSSCLSASSFLPMRASSRPSW